MAPKSKPNLVSSTGLIIPLSFIVLFAVNTVVLYLANLLFPEFVVLGTFSISASWAIFHSMILLALLDTFAIPVVHYIESKRGAMYTPQEWMLAYFFVNAVGLWVIARFADNLGFGIPVWWVAVLLGVAMDWLQGLAMMMLTEVSD